MVPSHLPVPLDRSRPFVSAVLAVIEGRGDVLTAIEALEAAEARCGVAIWWDLAGAMSLDELRNLGVLGER